MEEEVKIIESIKKKWVYQIHCIKNKLKGIADIQYLSIQ